MGIPPISFQIFLTLAGHWSEGTQVLIVNCLRKSYDMIGSLAVLCHGIQSQWGAKEDGGVGAGEEQFQTSGKAPTLFFRRLRDQYPAQPVDISFSNYLHFTYTFRFLHLWNSGRRPHCSQYVARSIHSKRRRHLFFELLTPVVLAEKISRFCEDLCRVMSVEWIHKSPICLNCSFRKRVTSGAEASSERFQVQRLVQEMYVEPPDENEAFSETCLITGC